MKEIITFPETLMDRYTETFATWNKIASLYQDKFMELDLYNESYDLICDSIAEKNARILEVGCGRGNITKYLLSKRPNFDIHGIDIAPNMIELARKNNPKASFEVMDCRNMTEIRKLNDAIVCGFCLPYLSPSDSLTFIKDCIDLLKDKGLLYISIVEGNPENSDFQSGSSGDRVFFYFYKLDDLNELLQKNNFGIIRTFKVDYSKTQTTKETHTIIIAKKKNA